MFTVDSNSLNMTENVKAIFLYGNNLEHILFKNAVELAENGGTIWFISPEPFKELPSGITVLNKEILKNITFLYLKEMPELLKQLNSIQTWYRIPGMVILNNFQMYRSNGDSNSVQWAYLCASLLDACRACSKKLSKGTTLLVAYDIDPTGDTLVQNIVDLYFDNVINSEELPANYIIPGLLVT